MEDELQVHKDGWKGKGKQKMLSNMPVTTYTTFSSLDQHDDHGEPNIILIVDNDHGEHNVIPITVYNHGESNSIPAIDDKFVPATLANNINIFIYKIIYIKKYTLLFSLLPG